MKTEKISNRFTTEDFRKAIELLNTNMKNRSSLHLDLNGAKFVSPFAVVLIEVYKDLYRKNGLELSVGFKKDGLLDGFIALIGRKSSKEFKKYFEKDYLEITRCNNSRDTFEFSNQITKILKNKIGSSEEVAVAASWLIGELADNSGIHGYECYKSEDFPDPVYLCSVEVGKYVYISVVDLGLGIVRNLNKNVRANKLRNIRKRDYLQKSLEEGFSGHPQGSPGFGLYGTSEIVKRMDGEIKIYSNEFYLKIINGNLDSGKLISDFNGTFIALKLRKDSNTSLSDIIQETIKEHILDQVSESQEDSLWI